MYRDGLSHLIDEFGLLERRIGALTQQIISIRGGSGGIPDGSIDHDRPEIDADIRARALASAEAGIFLPLPELGARLGLGRTEQRLLALCIAPDVDRRFGALFAEAQQGLGLVDPRRPSVGLALDILHDELSERILARSLLAPDAPLIRWSLMKLGESEAPLLSRPLTIDERIAAFLLQAPHGAAPAVPDRRLDDLILPEGLAERLGAFLKAYALPGSPDMLPAIFAIYGPEGSETDWLAEAIAAKLRVALLASDADELGENGEHWHRPVREAILSDAAILLRDCDAAPDGALRRIVAETPARLLFLTGTRRWRPTGDLAGRTLVEIELPRPGRAQRQALWETLIDDPRDAAALAAKFRFTPGRIRTAAQEAASRVIWSGGAHSLPEIEAVCRAQATPNLGALAQCIAPRVDGVALIVPDEARAQLEEICSRARHRDMVLEDWGFDQRLRLGKGLNALFCGAPGTGKTLGAEVIARTMALDLYRVDLSRIVSKYIGETEKQLGQLFDEAQGSDAILFFDEADALFGKRSEVKDAHDRYANIEIGYLLQRMEEYDGIAILATNLRRNLDDAFTRRLQFIVEFPYPEAAERARIWRAHLPDTLPLAADVDVGLLAEAFTLSGAAIRNCTLAAAFQAASSQSPVAMRHMLAAVKREYQKMGHICQPAEFGRFPEELWEDAA